MALTATKFEALADHLAKKRIDFGADTIKCMLLSAYTPNYKTHAYLADALAAGTEAVGTGYVAGGAALTGVTWTKDGAGVWHLKGTIPPWDATGGSLAAKYALFYRAGADAASSPLIGAWNLDGSAGTVTATNDKFTLTQHADGIVTIA